MQASDVMVRDVVTVHPETDGPKQSSSWRNTTSAPFRSSTTKTTRRNQSEADLIHRVEIGTEKHRAWWLEAVTGATTLAEEFAKAHGKKVGRS